MLAFVVIGLTSGAVYALAGMGLVLTYTTSGVFNFAHGALATVAAYVFYALFVLNRWPWPLAALVAIGVVGPAMGLAFELLARRLQSAPQALHVAATVGVFLIVQAAVYLIYGTEAVRNVPVFLGAGTVRVAGANVQVSQIVTFACAVVAALVFTAYVRRTRRGMAMRALVDDAELLDVVGTSPVAIRRRAWVIGVTLAAASGVLFAPLLPLDPVELTLLVASAFGAAAVGAFTSLPLTFAGGLGIGVLSALCAKWFTGTALLGIAPAVPFIVLFAVVNLLPRRRVLMPAASIVQTPVRARVASLELSGGVILVAALALVPLFAGVHVTDWTTFLAISIVFLSLGLLVRTAGQLMLCQVAFMAIGASAFSHLAHSGIPWAIAVVLAGAIAVPVGLFVSARAIRLPPVYLALATFAFGVVLQDVSYTTSYMFGASGLGLDEPRPDLSWLPLDIDKGLYYLILAIAILAAALVVTLTHGRLGRLLRRADEAPAAVRTSGAEISVTRLVTFAIAAFLAAVGGALAGVSQGTVIADSYPPLMSLTYLAAIVIVPGGPVLSAVLAAVGLVVVPSYIPGFQTATVLQLIFGVSVVIYAVLPSEARAGPRLAYRALARSRARASGQRPAAGHVAHRPSLPGSERVPNAAGRLALEEVTVRLGGRAILDGTSLVVEPGRIVGLIGPNGAGKTSVINVCSGLLRPSRGRLRVDEIDLAHRTPAARARIGVRRTFQRPQLFEALTVRENVEAGAEAWLAGRDPRRHLRSRRGDQASIRSAADRAIELCGLSPLADALAAELSPGHRRLVELARCLAGGCRFLLLDEPCSGLSQAETRRVAEVLQRAVLERGIGILLVEHNVSLALSVCEHLHVLDLGRVIFQGPPADVRASEIVKTTYLGASPSTPPGRRESGGRRLPSTSLSDMATSGLGLRGIVAGYGRDPVLRALSLRVPAGHLVALVGVNGAGKSTLLRVAGGLRPASAGEVMIDGRSVTRAPAFERVRAGICLIPEGPGVFPSLTVSENLALDTLHGPPDGHVDRVLKIFPPLKDRLGQRAGTMSGGEQRMLALARCFLADPKVVLVDELSTGLAPRVIEALFAALVPLTAQGVGLLIVEQYATGMLASIDAAYVLSEGQVVSAGAGSDRDLRALGISF